MQKYRMRKVRPIGVFTEGHALGLLGEEKIGGSHHLVLGHGHGDEFQLEKAAIAIALPLGRNERVKDISEARISKVLDQKFLAYCVKTAAGPEMRVAAWADDDEFHIWQVQALNQNLMGSGMVVPEYKHKGQYVIYYGDGDIRLATSKNLVTWHAGNEVLAAPREDSFDMGALKIISVSVLDDGILVLYQSTKVTGKTSNHSVGEVLFSKTDPEKILWRADAPLYECSSPAAHGLRFIGSVISAEKIILYLADKNNAVSTKEFANPYLKRPKAPIGTRLHRAVHNPIMSPTVYEWESQAVFNPAAVVDEGRVHLLYRAMGPDGVSRIGYASSADGIHFDERLAFPVFSPSDDFGIPKNNLRTVAEYNLQMNPSGGGWAGCEDPRIVAIDGHAYMSFTAFDGWNFIRMALTSIPLADMRKKNWQWKKPVMISKPGEIHKNWVIFPEKINGKYAVLHGLSPKIHVEYIDSLDELDGENYIQSLPPHGGFGYQDASRKDHWDNRVRGAGAPPLKTPMGWLLLYHATDKRDPSKYKLGAMLLDLENPEKVIYRTNAPILEPEEWYENDGKPGVVYTCGAVILNDHLIVYYGGGDKHIAVARANVQHLLDGMRSDEPVSMSRMTV